MITEKNKKILTWHQAVTWFFVFLVTGSFLFGKNVLAYTGDYNKATNGSLSATEWNNLINDFVVIRSNGNVGIGMVNPQFSIHSTGDIAGNRFIANNANGNNWVGNRLEYGGYNGGPAYGWNVWVNGSEVSAFLNDRVLLFGNVGIGAASPNDTFSIGSSGSSAPAGSSGTGHNFTSTYIASDSYALTNVGYVNSLIGSATSSMPTLWSGTAGGNIWSANSGNVGIGTTNPGRKFSVVSTTGSGVVADFTASGTSLSTLVDIASTGTTPKDAAVRLQGASNWTFGVDGNNNGSFGIYNGNNFPSNIASTSKFFTINTTGNVGIGTTNPSGKLSVTGLIQAGAAESNTVDVSSWTAINTNYMLTGPAGYWGLRAATNHSINFDVYNSGSQLAALTILQSGNVGIGTNNPGSILHIKSATPELRLEGTTGTEKITFYDEGATKRNSIYTSNTFPDQDALMLQSYSDDIKFRTKNNTEDDTATAMIIQGTSGNVGIGTTAPNDILSITNTNSAAPAGSSGTGHNFTSTYLNTDTYALTNVGYVKSLIGSATSSIVTTAKYAGVTVNTYSGNNAGTNGNVPGYDAANALCNTDVPGSHVCMAYEMLYTISAHGTMPTDSIVWIFNGPPGYTVEANDCDGRSKNVGTSYGAVWQTDINKWVNGRGMLTACSNANKFACCK